MRRAPERDADSLDSAVGVFLRSGGENEWGENEYSTSPITWPSGTNDRGQQ